MHLLCADFRAREPMRRAVGVVLYGTVRSCGHDLSALVLGTWGEKLLLFIYSYRMYFSLQVHLGAVRLPGQPKCEANQFLLLISLQIHLRAVTCTKVTFRVRSMPIFK